MSHKSSFSNLVFAANLWQVAGRILGRVFDFILLIILSRLLPPSEFGLAALAMSVIYITEAVTALPLMSAMVSKKDLTGDTYDTAFTLALLRGGILGCILIVAAFIMSAVYDDMRLLPLILVLSLAPILRGLGSPMMVNYLRKLDFRQQTFMEVAGKAIALVVATGFAFMTHSYWAIITASICNPLVMFVVSYCFAPYRPRITLSQWVYFRGFVGWNSLAQFFAALNWQMDRLLLGRLASNSSLGHFAMSTDVTGILTQAIVAPMAGPLLSAFARRNEQSPEDLAHTYLKSTSAVFAVAAPLFLGLSLLADETVLLVLGPSWRETGTILQALALICIISLPVSHLASLAVTLNKVEMFAWRTFVEFLVTVPTLLLGGLYFGIPGILVARAVSSIVVLLVGMQAVRNLISCSYGAQLWAFHRSASALVALAASVLALRPFITGESPLVLLVGTAVVSIIGGTVYIVTIFLLWSVEGRPKGLEHYVWDRMKMHVLKV